MALGHKLLRGSLLRCARLRRAFACAALICGALACGTAEPAAATQSLPWSDTYEGSNFYEPEGGSPTPPPAPSNAPGFYELVSGEQAPSSCPVPPGALAGESRDEPALVCPPIARESISDFTFMTGESTTNDSFGSEGGLRGGTFFYPDGAGALRSDVTEDHWHLSGSVAAISGFGLYMSGCSQLDASSYRGIAFTLWGQVAAGGSLVFFVGTAENQVSDVWVNENKLNAADPDEPPNLGRCIPVSNRYDGSCTEPRVTLSVSETPTEVQVLWRDLSAGCPQPSVEPSELTAIAWYFSPSAEGAYAVDIHVDDLRFINMGPL